VTWKRVIGKEECGDLGYVLGYLRHGSFRSGFARWPDRSRTICGRTPIYLERGIDVNLSSDLDGCEYDSQQPRSQSPEVSKIAQTSEEKRRRLNEPRRLGRWAETGLSCPGITDVGQQSSDR
jgi:hypothetical protein